MSKKHFRDLAIELHAARPDEDQPTMHAQWRRCVDAVADVCAIHNFRFDREKFITACYDGLRPAKKVAS